MTDRIFTVEVLTSTVCYVTHTFEITAGSETEAEAIGRSKARTADGRTYLHDSTVHEIGAGDS